jgi:hypothetical protein
MHELANRDDARATSDLVDWTPATLERQLARVGALAD